MEGSAGVVGLGAGSLLIIFQYIPGQFRNDMLQPLLNLVHLFPDGIIR